MQLHVSFASRRFFSPLSRPVLRRVCLTAICALTLLTLLGALLFGPTIFANPSPNDEGIAPTDGVHTAANFDGGGGCYSNTALTGVGFAPGAKVHANGLAFIWPQVAEGHADNWQADGQSIDIPSAYASGGALAFLGAASNGPSSGVATIHYSDGTIQTFTLGFSDWTLNGGRTQVMAGDSIAATTSYHDLNNGTTVATKTYVFYTAVTTQAGKTMTNVVLPSRVSQGALHIFALSGLTTPLQPNNEGVSPTDGLGSPANFDGRGNTYSNAALTGVGYAAGAFVTVSSQHFFWPTIASGARDNWQAGGQTLPLSLADTTTLGILGAASNGVASGIATVHYTDGSTQTFTLALSDWTLNGGKAGLLPGESVATSMSYRDSSAGKQEHVTTYVFYVSVGLIAGKTAQSLTLPPGASGGQLHIFAVSGATPPAASDWSTYLGGLDRTGFNGSETILHAANIGRVSLKWSAHVNAAISTQPIEANGVVYWGAWDGRLRATNLSGALLWTANIGQTYDPNCDPSTVGVADTPTLGAIGSTQVIFVSGGNARFYALNAQNGAVIWSIGLGSPPDAFLWSSPLVYNGSVYVGVSSFGDCPLIQGKLVQMNAMTGAIQHIFAVVPDGCYGGSLWGSPTVDPNTGIIYIATGNSGSCGASEPYTVALVALRAADLSPVGSWRVPGSQQTGDGDFGATPTLFSATINGRLRQLVGAANKNGYYYALDRTNLGAGPLWEDHIAYDSGDCPQCGDGSISPSAWDGETLYVAGGVTTINGVTCQGSVRALNPANGAVLWAHCLQNGPVLGAVMAIRGVVIVTQGNWINALNAASGGTVFAYDDHNGGFYGAACVANGGLYAGDTGGNLLALGL